MGGAAPLEPPLPLHVLEEACGTAVLADAIVGSDFLPSEYPSPKNRAQIPTSPKNSTSSFPVPNVISVSCDEAIVQLLRAKRSLPPALPHPQSSPTTSEFPRRNPPARETPPSYSSLRQSPSTFAGNATAR